MAYLFAYGPCYACQQPFSFNPYIVPSITINGNREPICEQCIIRANPERIKRGLPAIVPLPGAYEPGACEPG